MIPPTISSLRSTCKRNKVTKGAIQIFFDQNGSFATVSYGINKKECDKMKRVSNIIWDLIDDERIKVWE